MKDRFIINPILKKEMMVGSRSMKMSWAIMAISAILTAIVVFVLLITNLTSSYNGYSYDSLIVLFPVLGCTECGLLSLMIPVITSASISGEREKQTLDIMLTTPMSPMAIVKGKLMSAMMIVMMYMIASIPVMSIAFVLGGLSWWNLIGLFIMLIYLGIYVGSVGIFCSSVVKKSIAATILTIVIGIGIIVGTVLIYSIGVSAVTAYSLASGNILTTDHYVLALIFLLNPYSPIFDFMLRAMSDSSIYEMLGLNNSIILDIIYRFWIPISMAINLFISYGFLKLAAGKLNSGAVKNKKRNKNKSKIIQDNNN